MKNITVEQKLKILLLNPNLFFSEKLKTEVDLKYPALIVLVTGIISILRMSLISNDKSLLYIVGHEIIDAYLGWIVITSVYCLIANIFKPSGSIKRIFEFVGYGFVPTIFGYVINLIVYFILRNSFNASPTNPQPYFKIYIGICLFPSITPRVNSKKYMKHIGAFLNVSVYRKNPQFLIL